MNLGKIRSFRIELAICLAVPLLVIAVIAIPGGLYIRSLRADLASRVALLGDIPLIESRLLHADKAMAPYCVNDGGTDKSGELAQMLNQIATDQGLTVRSVTSEKVVSTDNTSFYEYQIPFVAEGSLDSIVRAVDRQDGPQLCLSVESLRVKAKSEGPAVVYDLNVIYHANYLSSKCRTNNAGGEPVPLQLQKLATSVEALEQIAKKRKVLLDPSVLERPVIAVPPPSMVAPERAVAFRLLGVVLDGHKPLALTDRGICGVGDSIDRYTIITLATDHVVVESPSGRKERVWLYKGEALP